MIDTIGPFRNDTTVYRTCGVKDQIDDRPVMTYGGYQDNATHRKVRVRVEHALARMKCWKIPHDYRRVTSTLADAGSVPVMQHRLLAGFGTGCLGWGAMFASSSLPSAAIGAPVLLAV